MHASLQVYRPQIMAVSLLIRLAGVLDSDSLIYKEELWVLLRSSLFSGFRSP